MAYKPPYSLAGSMVAKATGISNLIGKIEGYRLLSGDLKLRRQNKIKTVRSSLAIEGNTLSEGQIADIIDGKLVIGSQREIKEVQNALLVYDIIADLDPMKEDDLLRSHELLMQGLIPDAGRYRQGGVGVIDGTKVIHIAPPFNMVPRLMGNLFDYLTDYEEETIIKSCVFHYEFEFIHPFSDGNGRMGRLWQNVILMARYPIMQFVPFETIIHQRQQGYYQALSHSQSLGNSDPFIHFMLDALIVALEEQASKIGSNFTADTRMIAFKEQLKEATFSRNDYQRYHKDVSTSTASRDLREAVDKSILTKSGEKRNTIYKFT